MELVEVQVIRPQAAQAEFQVFLGSLAVPLHGLAGQDHPVAPAVKGPPDLLFAVHVEMGGIVQSDAPLQSPAQHPHRLVYRQADNGDGAEPYFGDLKAGFPQEPIAHSNLRRLAGPAPNLAEEARLLPTILTPAPGRFHPEWDLFRRSYPP